MSGDVAYFVANLDKIIAIANEGVADNNTA